MGDRPSAIAHVRGDLFVAGSSAWLTRIDAATGDEGGDHLKAGDDINTMVAFGGNVWMTLGFDREVVRLDARTGKVRSG